MNNQIEELKNLIYNKVNTKFACVNDAIFDRLNLEINIIQQLNLIEYFLIYTKIIQICNYKNYLRSPGRNTACGSLVNYCLDITKINPLEHNLLFERFINPNSSNDVDIDIDVPKGNRKELINELKHKLPEYKIYQLLFHSLKKDSTYEKLDFKNIVYSVHPCATIITRENLKDDYIHASINGCNYLVMVDYFNQSKKLSRYNFDVLELEYLTKLQAVYNLISNEQYHPYKLPIDDIETFENLTKNGGDKIFQFNTNGMHKILKDFKPINLNDLSIINSVYRPNSQHNLVYIINNKENGYQSSFSDERIRLILEETYGVPVYQETIIELLNKIAGFDLNTSDLYRRKLTKRNDESKINKFKTSFTNGCKENSCLSKNEIRDLTELIIKLTPVTFPKSHSLSYTTVAYWGAYYKTHFKNHFDYVFND